VGPQAQLGAAGASSGESRGRHAQYETPGRLQARTHARDLPGSSLALFGHPGPSFRTARPLDPCRGSSGRITKTSRTKAVYPSNTPPCHLDIGRNLEARHCGVHSQKADRAHGTGGHCCFRRVRRRRLRRNPSRITRRTRRKGNRTRRIATLAVPTGNRAYGSRSECEP
jgi:hypothetical protein